MVRLTGRMQKRSWRAHEPVYRAARAARDALHELTVRVRYQACGDPVASGRAARRYDGGVPRTLWTLWAIVLSGPLSYGAERGRGLCGGARGNNGCARASSGGFTFPVFAT